MFEGDIKITEEQQRVFDEEEKGSSSSSGHSRKKRGAASTSFVKVWKDYPMGETFVVPYEIGDELSKFWLQPMCNLILII